MKRLRTLLVWLVAALVLVVGAALTWLYTQYPAVPPPEDVRIEATPERLARGQYLVDNVAGLRRLSRRSRLDEVQRAGHRRQRGQGRPAFRFR